MKIRNIFKKNNVPFYTFLVLIFLFSQIISFQPAYAATTLIHEFASGSGDGYTPWASVILSGTTLYGTTYYGDGGWNGIVFSMETNGSSFTILHTFSGSTTDGRYPDGDLLLSGTTLYGMTSSGGTDSDNDGTIFKIETNGTGFATMKDFDNASTGDTPEGNLVLSGGMLYGINWTGGSNGDGTLFKIDASDNTFTILKHFDNTMSTLGLPIGPVVVDGTTIYGVT